VIISLVIVSALVWPSRWRDLVGVACVLLDPRLGVLVLALALSARRGSGPVDGDDEIGFLAGVAAQLRSGSSLRHAIIDVGTATRLPVGAAVRLAAAGRPMIEVVEHLRPALALSAGPATMALAAGSLSGGRLAGALDAIVQLAFDEAEQRREVRAATSAAAASAWLIGALPAVTLVAVALGGRLRVLAALGAAGWTMVAAGIGLSLIGAATMISMARSVDR
jgi:Flp pilus assembly protein TadB